MVHKKEWLDMSEYLVHFTKDYGGRNADSNIMSILSGGELIPGPNRSGCARYYDNIGDSQRCVCFSEIPPGYWERLTEKYSLLGIAFRKRFVLDKGGAPVWYVEKDGHQQKAISEMVDSAAEVRPDGIGANAIDASAAIWRMTPFIDFPGNWRGSVYRFEWEREWRVVGPFEFGVEDVAFLFIPEELHAKAREFFTVAKGENTGPSYSCPFIDPRWPLQRVLAECGED